MKKEMRERVGKRKEEIKSEEEMEKGDNYITKVIFIALEKRKEHLFLNVPNNPSFKRL